MDVDGTAVVGTSWTSSGQARAFAYDLAAPEPAMLDLGTLGGRYAVAVAVDGSVVVGRSETTDDVGPTHAFAYDLAAAEPAMLDLGQLEGGWSEATAVDGNLVTGEGMSARGRSRAFVYDLAASAPTMRSLGTLGGPGASAADVEGSVVVGWSSTEPVRRLRAFAYELAAPEPAMRDLGTVKGGAATWTMASEIDGDIVVGSWRLPRRGHLPYAMAYHLGADEPAVDLGTWRGSDAVAVDGYVAAGWATKGSATHATAWVLRETTKPMIAFRRFDRRVKESAGRVVVRVNRYGRTDRAVTVRYRTRSDTASAGRDFASTSGTLRFARGVTRRSFTVKILEDARRERKEYLLMTLASPSSPALLGTPKWSQLTVNGNHR